MNNFNILSLFMNSFLASINSAYAAILPAVNYLLSFMIVMTIVVTAICTWIWGDFEGMIRGLVGKIMLIGFIIWAVAHWQQLSDDIGGSLTKLGLLAGGNGASPDTFLQNPQTIIMSGWLLCAKIVALADELPSGHFGLDNFVSKLLLGITAISIFIAFMFMAVEVIVTWIEFKIINLAALIFVPFAIWQKTEFLSQRSFGYMFSAGMKLFVMALVVSIGVTLISTLGSATLAATTPENALQASCAILAGAVLLTTLTFSVPKLAQALITGGPQLGASAAALGTGVPAAAIGGAGALGARALGGAGQGGGAMIEHGNQRNSEAFEEYRRAATAGGEGNANATTLSQMAKASATESGSTPPNNNPPSGAA